MSEKKNHSSKNGSSKGSSRAQRFASKNAEWDRRVKDSLTKVQKAARSRRSAAS
jgi:hypothetical protein